MPAMIKFECPNCHQVLAAEPEPGADLAEITCPTCAAKFTPPAAPAPPLGSPPKYSPQEVAAAKVLNQRQLAALAANHIREIRSGSRGLHDQASLFVAAACIAAAAGAILLLAAVISGLSVGLVIGGCTGLGLALGSYAVAQLLRIRAALENPPPPPRPGPAGNGG